MSDNLSELPLLSVIIPTLNEASQIADTIASVRESCGTNQCELIVVDGGSTDDTLKQAANADQALTSPPGRAKQQNTGAAASRGDILLFLHADCRLQPDCLPTLFTHFKQHPETLAGCFRQTIDASGLLYRWLEWGNAFRVKRWGIAYGDQAIFIRRDVFEELNRFPDVPLMEDLMLMKALKRKGQPQLLDAHIMLSARRWQKTGVIRQTARNWIFLTLFRFGVSPQTLARFYPHIR